MKLIFVNPNPLPSPDPESLQVIQTVAALSKNAEIHLIVRKGLGISVDEYYDLPVPQGLHIHFLPGFKIQSGPMRLSWNMPFFLFSLFRIVLLKKSLRINAIFVRNLKLGAFLLKWRNFLDLPPILFESHEVFSLSFLDDIKRKKGKARRKAKKLERLERFVYTNVSGLICITGNLSRMISEKFNIRGRLLVAPDGVNLEPFQKVNDNFRPERINNSHRTLLYMGSLHHWKGVNVLLEAMQYLQMTDLLIVGGSRDSVTSYKKIARQLKVDNKVHFEGFVPPGERFKYFACADVCVLPLIRVNIASYFTSPLKLFEYMASGKPVVASDLPSIREVISDNINGILVEPENPKALAEAVRRLLDEQDLGDRLASRARADVKEFTWDKRAEKINSFIRLYWNDRCAE